MNDEVSKQSVTLDKFYNCEEFKVNQRELEQLSKEVQIYYNRPEFKRLQKELAKSSADFSKNYSFKFKKIPAQMSNKGESIGLYYQSAALKKMNEELEKKYNIPHHHNYQDSKDENYTKYQSDLESRTPAEVKLQQEQLADMGKQISAQFATPEFKDPNMHLQALGDSLKQPFNSPEFKLKQKEIERISKRLSNYENNPQLKRAHVQWERAVKNLTGFITSPEYKAYIKRMVKDAMERSDYNPETIKKSETFIEADTL